MKTRFITLLDALGWRRRRQLLMGTASLSLFASFFGNSLQLLWRAVPTLLLCLPTSLLALVGVHIAQRYRRLPVPVLVSACLWGCLVAIGFGSIMTTLWIDYGTAFFTQDLLAHDHVSVGNPIVHTALEVRTGTAFFAGVFEEVGKAAVVALAVACCGRRFDGVVSGLVLGAAAGIGFNLAESVLYVGAQPSAFQFWMRQEVGLLASHVAFSAVAGAGIGLATQLSGKRERSLAVGSGLLAAIGGHLAADTMFPWYGKLIGRLAGQNAVLEVLLLQPGTIVLTSGVFVILYVVLLRRGLAAQRLQLRYGLAAERDTVSAQETTILLDPRLRLGTKLLAYRRGGLRQARALARLQAAQIDLGMRHPNAPAEALRETIGHLRVRCLQLPESETEPEAVR